MQSLRNDGIVIFEPPSRRQRLARRKTVVVALVVAIAAAGWLFGALSDTPPQPTTTRAFSAFTSS
jgi:hypothetical protein